VVTVHERCVGDVTIIDVAGRITEDGAVALRALVQPLVRQGRVKIVFDLQETPYIDTTALGEIVRAHASATRGGGGLKLLHVTPKVHQLLTITHLDSVLGEFDDEATVVNSFERSRP
jgi:anti-sigma B factor antagonist